jgi:hypothetical protein
VFPGSKNSKMKFDVILTMKGITPEKESTIQV